MTVHSQPFAIIVEPSLWRGWNVAVEPPTATHPLRHFHCHPDAIAFAEELARVEGWPVRDRSKEPC